MGAIIRRPQGVLALPYSMSRQNWTLRQGSSADPIRCAVFISGSGSGMEAMLTHQKSNIHCGHTTAVVISDRHDALGLEKARNFGIPAKTVPVPSDTNREERRRLHEHSIQSLLEEMEVELILLSGYMRLLSASFVERWAPYLLNIHPSLLPAFPGAHAHRDVLASSVDVSGCTVHFVDAGMDTGAIIAQRRVPVFSDDDEHSLAARVRLEEHQLYPEVVDRLVK